MACGLVATLFRYTHGANIENKGKVGLKVLINT